MTGEKIPQLCLSCVNRNRVSVWHHCTLGCTGPADKMCSWHPVRPTGREYDE